MADFARAARTDKTALDAKSGATLHGDDAPNPARNMNRRLRLSPEDVAPFRALWEQDPSALFEPVYTFAAPAQSGKASHGFRRDKKLVMRVFDHRPALRAGRLSFATVGIVLSLQSG